jgi:hypothetical protein
VEKIDGTNEPGWLYFGCSKDAFKIDTQGKGPFCGHVNGALVMKELERPWVHWHSSMSPKLEDCLDPESPLFQEDLLQDKGGVKFGYLGKADDLEKIVVRGLEKWYV